MVVRARCRTVRLRLTPKPREAGSDRLDALVLFREAIKTFIGVQSAKRLAALGAVTPDMPEISRRREDTQQ